MNNKTMSVSIVVATAISMAVLLPGESLGQGGPFGEALGGAVMGGVLGAIVGGDDGAAAGAIIGGGMGMMSGISKQEQRRKQAELEARRQQERADLERQRRLEQERLEGERKKVAQETQGYDPVLISEIQRSLIRLGYDPGPVGRMNPKTEEAVKAYQRDKGLLVTGRLSQELLTHMIQHGG